MPDMSKCFHRDEQPGRPPIAYFAWGCFQYFGWACLPRWPCGQEAWLAKPKLAKAGGPGRTRTCNQTVMSAGKGLRFLRKPLFSKHLDHVRITLFDSFLWRSCGGRSPLGLGRHLIDGVRQEVWVMMAVHL